jgi:hypothetical protein
MPESCQPEIRPERERERRRAERPVFHQLINLPVRLGIKVCSTGFSRKRCSILVPPEGGTTNNLCAVKTEDFAPLFVCPPGGGDGDDSAHVRRQRVGLRRSVRGN